MNTGFPDAVRSVDETRVPSARSMANIGGISPTLVPSGADGSETVAVGSSIGGSVGGTTVSVGAKGGGGGWFDAAVGSGGSVGSGPAKVGSVVAGEVVSAAAGGTGVSAGGASVAAATGLTG